MKIKACVCTDVGVRGFVNQDAALVKSARTYRFGTIAMAAVCDGIGGYDKGEIASCKMIRNMEDWFASDLPDILKDMNYWDQIEKSLLRLIQETNAYLCDYGFRRGIDLGTTLTGILVIAGRYLSFNVGDSRVYVTDQGNLLPLTKDQSYQNALLECVGVTDDVEPAFERGVMPAQSSIIACSDGMWRTMDEKESYRRLCPRVCISEESMYLAARDLVDLAIKRGEKDNITITALSCEDWGDMAYA